MLIGAVESPEGRRLHVAVALPSVYRKTNCARLLPPSGHGWTVPRGSPAEGKDCFGQNLGLATGDLPDAQRTIRSNGAESGCPPSPGGLR